MSVSLKNFLEAGGLKEANTTSNIDGGEGNVKTQRISINPFGIFKQPINVYTRKKHNK